MRMPSSIIGWDIGLAKEFVDRLAKRDKHTRIFGYYEIKQILGPALANAHKAGWDDCAERVQKATMKP